jgi:hypothetical protein
VHRLRLLSLEHLLRLYFPSSLLRLYSKPLLTVQSIRLRLSNRLRPY